MKLLLDLNEKVALKSVTMLAIIIWICLINVASCEEYSHKEVVSKISTKISDVSIFDFI